MAINPNTNATMSGRITAPDANYPYGSSKDETAPGAGDGTPYFKGRADDILGFQQALLRAAGIVPSGNADTAVLSQYLKSVVELASGRANTFNEGGTSTTNLYTVDLKTDQQGPAALFDGMGLSFITAFTGTGVTATLDVSLILGQSLGTTVKNIKLSSGLDPSPGDISGRVSLIYDLINDWFELQGVVGDLTNPAGFIDGLLTENAAVDPVHDITIKEGSCSSSTGGQNLALVSPLTKRIDSAWVAGDGAGGLFSGGVAADTWYHVFLIKKDSDGSIDAGFDTSITAANIPAGYTAYRRVASVLTDGSADILGFTQINDYFIWDEPILDFSGSGSTSRVLQTVSTPPDVETMVFMNTFHATDGGFYLAHPDTTDLAPSSTVPPLQSASFGGATNVIGNQQVSCMTNAAAQVARRHFTTATVRLATYQYLDFRGKR